MELLKDLMEIQVWPRLFKNKDLMQEMDVLVMLFNKKIISLLKNSHRKFLALWFPNFLGIWQSLKNLGNKLQKKNHLIMEIEFSVE